jgi:hypothetical protein
VVRVWLTDPDDESVETLALAAAALTPRPTAEFAAAERRAYTIDAFVGAYPLSASGNVNVRPWPWVKSLAVWPGEPETLMALTNESFLLRSQDQGTSWVIGDRLPLTLTVNSLGLPAHQDDPLLLATAQGLYRYNFAQADPMLDEAGDSLATATTGAAGGSVTLLNTQPFVAVSYSHTNLNELWGVSGDTVYKSEDGGVTWGEASNELNTSTLVGPLLMAPPNNNPQFVAGPGLFTPSLLVWRGAGNGFWKRPPELPALPLGLANATGMAWDSGNATLYLGGLHGELFASANAAATDERIVTAEVVHDFGDQGRPVPLAVGSGPTLYITRYDRFGPVLLRGVWNGDQWTWEELRLPIVAAG